MALANFDGRGNPPRSSNVTATSCGRATKTSKWRSTGRFRHPGFGLPALPDFPGLWLPWGRRACNAGGVNLGAVLAVGRT
jgi:hypothetical protein